MVSFGRLKLELHGHRAAIAAAMTPRQKIVLNLLRWTGVRAGEAVSLTDEDIDLARREIHVRTSKTARTSHNPTPSAT
jgi:integrase